MIYGIFLTSTILGSLGRRVEGKEAELASRLGDGSWRGGPRREATRSPFNWSLSWEGTLCSESPCESSHQCVVNLLVLPDSREP